MNTYTYVVTTTDGEVHRARGTVMTTESLDGHLLLSIADQSSGHKRTVAIFRSWDYVTFEPDNRCASASMDSRGHCCRADA